MQDLQSRMMKVAENHGFHCRKGSRGCIVVFIDWIDTSSKSGGVEKFEVCSMKELFEILGY